MPDVPTSRGSAFPKYLSSDHDPLYRFHQWHANLRILDVMEIRTVPDVPLSHPFVKRLIGKVPRGSSTTRKFATDRLKRRFPHERNVPSLNVTAERLRSHEFETRV